MTLPGTCPLAAAIKGEVNGVLLRPALDSLPSEAGRLEGTHVFSFPCDFAADGGWFPFAFLSFSVSLLPEHTSELFCFDVGTFEPGFGIPLDEGIKLSFLADVALLPLGIRLAIFEVFFAGVSGICSFSSFTTFSVHTLLLSLLFSSLSFGCSKDFLLLIFLLPAFGGANLGDIFGLFVVDPALLSPPLKLSISLHSKKASSSLSLSVGPEFDDRGGRKTVRALTSLNFSNMDFCPEEGVLGPSERGGLSLSAGGVGEVAGLCCFTDSMVEVALCLTFIDLLRQGLLALGEGMAETGCCPVVVGCCTFPFIPADG